MAEGRLGRDADWLARVETGFVVPGLDEVSRILVKYRIREAHAANVIIDMARRASSTPPWLALHVTRLSADARDLILLEAQATLAQVHGCRLIPFLAQSEGYFRAIAPGILPGCNPGQEWELLSDRQAHQPAGVTRLLDVVIDESALDVRLEESADMVEQVHHLLALDDSPHATVRVIPWGAPFWEKRACNFDVLSFAGTTDRIGVAYTAIGASLASGGHPRPLDPRSGHRGRPRAEPGNPRRPPGHSYRLRHGCHVAMRSATRSTSHHSVNIWADHRLRRRRRDSHG